MAGRFQLQCGKGDNGVLRPHEVAHSGNDFVKVRNYAVGRDFSKPVFTQTSIGFEEASRPTVFTLLKKLEEAGIIARISDASGRTGAVYALRELLEIAGGSD